MLLEQLGRGLARVLVIFVLTAGVADAAVPTLAVAEFDNHTGDPRYDVLGRGLADMLTTDLAQVGSLALVERARLQEILNELELSASGLVDPETAARAGQGLGARWIVVGAFVAVEPAMRIDARVIDVETAQVLHASSVQGPRDEFFLLEKDLAAAVIASIGAPASPRESMRMGRVETESFDAFFAWSRGLDALDRAAVDEARAAMHEALRHDNAYRAASATLQALEERTRALDVVRDERYSSELQRLLDAFDEAATADDRDERLPGLIQPLLMQMHVFGAAEQRAVAMRVLDMNLPETVRAGPSPVNMTANEWATASLVLASYALRERADVLTWGEVFRGRYPTSAWYPTVKGHMDGVVKYMEGEERGRAALSQVRAEAHLDGLRHRCARMVALQERADACRAAADAVDAAGVAPGRGLVLDHAKAARDLGDVDALALIVTWGAGHLPEERSWLDDQLRRLRANVDEAGGAFDKIARAHTAGQAQRPAESLLRAGRFADAREAAAQIRGRWPDQAAGWRLAAEEAFARGDLAATEAALIAWGAALGEVSSQWELNLERARLEAAAAEEWEARGVSALASRLRAVGLMKEAGDAFVRLAREHPEYSQEPAPTALRNAGDCYLVAMVPGTLDDAFHAYTAVVQEFPNSPEAARARANLAGIRR